MPKKATKDYNLGIRFPALIKEWNTERNVDLTPYEVLPFAKKKVWWICNKGDEWLASIGSRSIGTGCPYCLGRKVNTRNCLASINPDLAKEWHPTKNGELTSNQITPFSNRYVWWKCSINSKHEWKATVNNRSQSKHCPYCTSRYFSLEKNLSTINPSLAKEWHPTKNGNLTPAQVMSGTGKKVWWRCTKNPEHEWVATINSRNNGIGCPFCHSKTSVLELRVYSELKYFFSDTEHRNKIFGIECDVFIPSLHFAIEIDGYYWHKDKVTQDAQKTSKLLKHGINLLHIREEGLPKIMPDDIFSSRKISSLLVIKAILKKILLMPINNNQRKKIILYTRNQNYCNNALYNSLLDMLPGPLPGYSLLEKNPELAKEWHPTMNGKLSPNDVTYGSEMQVWWKCQKNNEHVWIASVNHRYNRKTGCPYCSHHIASDDNNLAKLFPALINEWYTEKNKLYSPNTVLPQSNIKVWWRCNKNHFHIWQAKINQRVNGNGCPFCSGRYPTAESNLQVINPTLAKQWHPLKNGKLTPLDVTPGSSKKVWWQCPINPLHEWITSVSARSKGTDCPYCKKVFILDIKQMQKIAEKRHGKCLSKKYYNTNRKLQWQCEKGHKWWARPYSIKAGSWCPYCSGNVKSTIIEMERLASRNKGKCISKKYINANTKLQWQCEKGHKWWARPTHIKVGSWCPTCAIERRRKNVN